MNCSSRWADHLVTTMPLKVCSCLAWILFLACISACSPAPPEPSPQTQTLVGAWALADAYNPEVQEAARFAVQTFAVQNKARVLYKDVMLAHQQMVAGLNVALHLQVTLEGVPRNVQAVVWRQLDGTYSLQSWVWMD